LVVEAVVEDLSVKQSVFRSLECTLNNQVILATNTSSLSITSIASVLDDPPRLVGIHFFNPPGIMQLVEIVSGHLTNESIIQRVMHIITSWGKIPVSAIDSPGFIVNKVARPFYSEAIRIYEEGLASPGEIDWVMITKGGFRMGPFTLMDYIGHDVNYAVTESIWKAFYHEPRYKPSHIQKKLVEAGFLGRKSGRGFYDYHNNSEIPLKEVEDFVADTILRRILFMLINEAADTIYHGICSINDVELAMTRGVNYPRGLLSWGEECGWCNVASFLDSLYDHYHEERYRVSPYITNKLTNDQS